MDAITALLAEDTRRSGVQIPSRPLHQDNMSNKSRQKRIEDQDKDDGDPEEDVLMLKGTCSSHYHSTKDCRTIQQGAKTVWKARHIAQRRWLGPCPECVLGD